MRKYNAEIVIQKIDRIEKLWDLDGQSSGAYSREYDAAVKDLYRLVGKKVADEILPKYVFHEYY